MSLSFDRSAALIAENSKFVAGGVNSNFRIGMAGGPLERGAWFVSFAHDDAVIDATLDAVRGAAKDIA